MAGLLTADGISDGEDWPEEPDLRDWMPKFSEVSDPIAAMLWIRDIEHIFMIMKRCGDNTGKDKCDDEDKVVHAVSKLRSEALLWWDNVKDTNGRTKMTWSKFLELFKEEFCPIRIELSLFEEHKTFKRGSNQTVKEYTDRFEELWWFVSEYLTPEKRKIYSFVWGLRDDIKKFISPSHMISWNKIVAVASAIEEENNKRLEISRCADCGKIHDESGECLSVPNECTGCGKQGHLAHQCFWGGENVAY